MTLVPLPVELPAWTTDLLTKLAGPSFEEMGLTLRDKIRMFRGNRQIRFLEEFRKKCSAAGIEPKTVKMSLLCDIFENASLEDDDELQDLWVNLLANAADPECNGLVSSAFPEILKDLSKDEAVFLGDFYKKKRAKAEELAEMTRLGIDIEPMGIQQVYLDNLKRLRLIDWIDRPEGVRFVRSLEELGAPTLRITAFGGAFIDACTAPKKKRPNTA